MSMGAPEIGGLRGRLARCRHRGRDGTAGAVRPAREARRPLGRRPSRVDYGDSCVVEAEVFRAGALEAVRPGPYTFADAHQATAFVTEAVEVLMYLGCDVLAQ